MRPTGFYFIGLFIEQSWHAAAWVGFPTHAYPALRAPLANVSA